MDTSAWTQLPTLEGPRVRLRWLDTPDLARIYEVFSDPKVMRYWSTPAWEDRGRAQTLLDQIKRCFAERSLFQWGIEEKATPGIIGTTTLAHLDFDNGRAELGYALRHDHWGGGWMREAIDVLADFAFADLGLRRLEADVDPRNDRSVALLERIGFVKEGLLRERWCVAGEIQDAAFYGLLAKERPLRFRAALPIDGA
jgi:[ribosomal protein S5]-alanine N-acetyltransferase